MTKFKLLLLLVTISLSSIHAYAGDDDGGKKGIRAGWQSSNFYYENSDSDKSLNSFYIGVFGEKKLIPFLRLGTGIEYNSSGTQSEDGETSYARHVIGVPIYLKTKLGPVYALGGLAANFGVANSFKILGETVDPLPDEMKTNTFNMPVYLGLGFKFLMFSVEARYHWGTMNLSKQENVNLKNEYFQLGAAVSF